MQLKHFRLVILLLGLIILAGALSVMLNQTVRRQVPSIVSNDTRPQKPFTLSSPAFSTGSAIPTVFTCLGQNISPPLVIENPPTNTQNFVLIARNSSNTESDKVYWLVWNIDKDVRTINQNSLPTGASQGLNDDKQPGYHGPCLNESNTYAYYTLELYALNDTLNLPVDTTYDRAIATMNGKVIARTILTGTVQPTKQ